MTETFICNGWKLVVKQFIFRCSIPCLIKLISSHYRQIFADIKMTNHKIKTSFDNWEGLKAWINKTCNDFMIFILCICEKLSVFRCYSWFFSMVENRLYFSGFQSVSKTYWNNYLVSGILNLFWKQHFHMKPTWKNTL